MKLRQKLAMVLAATMVVTAVPVVTMAASTNRVTQTQTVKKDAQYETSLIIKLDDALTTGSIFFLEVEGGDIDTITVNNDKIEIVDAKADMTTVVVRVKDGVNLVTGELRFDIKGTAKAAETILTLSPENTTLKGEKFVIAKTTDAKATVTVGDAPTFYTNGTLAPITIEETIAKTIAKDNKFTINLENDDFKFVGAKGDVIGKVEGLKGITGVTATVKKVNDTEAVVEVTDVTSTTARGALKISGLKVTNAVKTPDTGDLMATVSGSNIDDKEVKVAKISDYGVTVKMADDKVVDVVAGQEKEIKFTLAENVDDSIVNNRNVDFTLSEGYFTTDAQVTISNGTFVDYILDKDNNRIGFTATLDEVKDKADSYEVKGKVAVPVDFTGEIKVTVEGRAIGEDLEVVAINAIAPVKVETEAAVLKVGLKDQVAGKVVITETEKGRLAKGKTLVFDLADERGVEFTAKPSVKVTSGDIQLGDVELTKDGKLIVEIKRASKEASTIEVEGFGIKLDRTVPQGKYDLTIGGGALVGSKTLDGTGLVAKDFFIVGTPNTEDITNGMRKGTATFTNAATTYTVNGEAKDMDAAAYISKAGRMMLPVRYVSEAFGIEGNNVIFADGTVTILAGTRTLQLKNGSDIAVLNGASIKMAEKVVITNGRTYVPVGEVGRLLGVSVSFDDATKTATFTNK